MDSEYTIKVSNIPALHALVTFYKKSIEQRIIEGLEYEMEIPTENPFSADIVKHIKKAYPSYRLENAPTDGMLDSVDAKHISDEDYFTHFKSGDDEFTVIMLSAFMRQVAEIMKDEDTLYSTIITDIDLSEVKSNLIRVEAITVTLGDAPIKIKTIHGEIRSFGKERYKNILFY